MNKLLCLLLLVNAWACSTPTTQIINTGVAGNATSDLLDRVEKDVVNAQPDIVIMMAGTNDMVNSRKLVSYSDFAENYEKILGHLSASGGLIVLMSPPPVDTANLFKRHDRKAFNGSPNACLDSATTIISMLAAERGLHFININRILRSKNSPNPTATSPIMNMENSGRQDGVHPTHEGYELIATEIFQIAKSKRPFTEKCQDHLFRRQHDF